MFSRIAAAFVRRRKKLDQRQQDACTRFRPSCECLEDRSLLASIPVSVLHTFSTPQNATLTITSGSSVN